MLQIAGEQFDYVLQTKMDMLHVYIYVCVASCSLCMHG